MVLFTLLTLAGLVVTKVPAVESEDSAPRGKASSGILPAAVGRLLIPAIRYEQGYPRHYDERCSATVVAPDQSGRSSYVLSAWHCLEDYRDLSRPLVYADARGEHHPARVLATGGGMDRDWALLQVRTELPGALNLALDTLDDGDPVALAGYPRSEAEVTLRVLEDCAITGLDGRDLRTDCVLQRGASGGAVIRRAPTLRLVGVISRGDGVSQSIFVPVSRFLKEIQRYLPAES